ncbi:MAG: T9SS type A sorting domain-containing protein [Candidatus Zixiibacteriota bacterium]|nr:MAG: T9SS type A sorting domain-containing protein [candidate division Zixibacteria bacterium]
MNKTLTGMIRAVIFGLCFTAGAHGAQNINLGNNPSGVSLLNQTQFGLTLKIDIESIKLDKITTKAGSFTVLNIDGFTRSHKIGEPSLPMINRLISIPLGCEVRVEATDYEIEEIFLSDLNYIYPLLPVQPSLSKSQDPADVEFEYKPASYSQPGYYSLPLVSASDAGIMRALRLELISVAPIEYNPSENSIRIYKNLTVQVHFLNPDWETTMNERARCYSPFFEAVYGQIINYEPLPPTILDDLVTYPVKYVIIADRMFQAQLQPFIEWKIKKGFNVITAYTDDIGYSNTAIKSYIQGIYNNSNPPADPLPSFVLLVGDDQQIPAFSYSEHISDLDFCEFTGDHNPEIYYGRFSAQGPALLQPQINKTLEYEQYTMPDPSYMGNVTMIAGVDATHAPTYANGQINYGTNIYFNSQNGIFSNTWLYPQSAQPGASPAIIQTVNDGIGFINYTAHGLHDEWSNPSFTSSNVSSLTNTHKYMLAIANCCLTVTFGDDYSTPCVGEVWLQAENKGAVGYIGGSNSTYWDEDYWWGVGYGPVIGSGPSYEQTGLGVYDGVFHTHGEDVSDHYVVNDALIFCGNMAVQESGSNLTDYYWEIYHLLGDPSVMTYLGVPGVNNVQHAAVIVLGTRSFTVQADEASYVGLSKDGVLHGAAYIGETGIVNMDITPFVIPGAADLVVTAQNKQPYITTVQVSAPSGPYVIFDSCVVNDPAGNNDGIIDFGESILLDMQLKNVGPDTAYNVSAVLATQDTFVTLTDTIETFGNIIGDLGTVNIADAYAFDVAIEVPDDHAIGFELTITSTTDTWTSNFTLTAHAPVVEFVEVAIDDAVGGNGNRIFEAGETIDMVVTLENSGSSPARSVTGILSEQDDYVTISDANGAFGDIAPGGGTGNNSSDVFVVTAAGDMPPGHSIDFDLAVTADGGYARDLEFLLRTMESFEYSDCGWVGEGVWEWGEPTSGPYDAYDGARVWATVLGGQYSYNADDELVTKYYVVNESNAVFSFYHWYDTEDSYDGGNISISANGGNFELVTPVGGYPDNSVNGLDGEPGFTGSTGGWQQVNVSLGSYAGQVVKLRFRFGSDGVIPGDGWYIDAVIVNGATPVFGSPSINTNPNSFNVTLDQGQTTDQILVIGNDSDGILIFSIIPITIGVSDYNIGEPIYIPDPIRRNPNWGKNITYERKGDLLTVTYDGPKYENPEIQSRPQSKDIGEPDAFGYIWIDSNEPNGPAFNWIDISGTGQPLTFSDEQNRGPFDLGFTMPFYDNMFNSIRICSNGWLSFTSTLTHYSNQSIPTAGEPNNLVAPFWDDLDPSDGGTIYYYSNNADTFIVQYDAVPGYGGMGLYTFQAILTADGNIRYQYLSMIDDLISNTVGIENSDGAIGLEVVYNGSYVQSNLAVQIQYPLFWLLADPLFGYVNPGETADITVTFDAADLDPGTYTGFLNIESNDSNYPEIAVECTLTVNDVTGMDVLAGLPTSFEMEQNYPNPFNPATTFKYALPKESQVKINIYDILGRKVATLVDEKQQAGYYDITWNASDKTSGIYFARLETEEFSKSIKMIFLK